MLGAGTIAGSGLKGLGACAVILTVQISEDAQVLGTVVAVE
jgi:hypothetical protein